MKFSADHDKSNSLFIFQQWVPFCLTPESVCLVSTLLNSLLISYKIYKDFSDWCRRWHSTSHFTNCFPRQSGDIFKVTPTTSSGSGDRLWTRSCLLMCSYILLLILYKGLDYIAYSVLVRLWFLCFNTRKMKRILSDLSWDMLFALDKWRKTH